jgi:hypothetical protein
MDENANICPSSRTTIEAASPTGAAKITTSPQVPTPLFYHVESEKHLSIVLAGPSVYFTSSQSCFIIMV